MASREIERYRSIFLTEYGPLPHPCYFCTQPVERWGTPADELGGVIHHVDEDHYNNVLTNLAVGHNSCHTRHHWMGRQHSDATKAKISAAKTGVPNPKLADALRGRPLSAEHRAALSKAGLGKPKSVDHALHIGEAQRGRVRPKMTCPNCGAEFARSHRWRHNCATTRLAR